MKQILLVLSLIVPTVSQAKPIDHGRRDYRPQIRQNNHHRSHDRDLLFPALVLGATIGAVTILSQPPRDRLVVVERAPARPKEVETEIRGRSSYSFNQAQDNWSDACLDWKQDLRQDYRSVEATCGKMRCVSSDKTYCYSQTQADVW